MAGPAGWEEEERGRGREGEGQKRGEGHRRGGRFRVKEMSRGRRGEEGELEAQQ